jgi:redox-sensitive bicupin YhaK (pirin superfamily)
VKVIAGTVEVEGTRTCGPINGLTTDPTYLDVVLPAGAKFTHSVNIEHSAFLYPYEGRVDVGPAGSARPLNSHSAGVLRSGGDRIEVTAGPEGARFLVLAGRPLREPVVQYGPFVMNTRQEIEQAVRDFQSGALTRS